MALIKCPECGREISDTAPSCPNCGRIMQLEASQLNTPNNRQDFYSAQPNFQRQPKKKGHGCLITFLILCFVIVCFTAAITYTVGDAKENPDKYQAHIASKYIDVSDEQGKVIDDILKECGIETVKSFEHDELLNNAHFDGETGYRIAVNDNIDNIIVYLTADMVVYNIRYADYDLYLDGAVVATLQDYTFTTDEVSDLMISCEEKVKEILVSPSTAKFPNMMEWGFNKEKNIVTVQGYVDSQNGFGAELRSNFQFIIDTDTNTIQSFIFDGQEMMQ